MAMEPEAEVVTSRPAALTLSGVVAISLCAFVAALVVLHILRPELNSTTQFVSEYAVGDFGILMVVAFLAMSVASFSLVAALKYGVPVDALSRSGLILIGVWAAGILVLAVFPIGVGDTVDSTADIIHRLTAMIVFLAVSIGTLLVSRGFGRDPEWQPLARPGMILSIVLLVGFVVIFGGYAIEAGIEGLSQRIFLAVLVIWMGLVTWQHWMRRSTAS